MSAIEISCHVGDDRQYRSLRPANHWEAACGDQIQRNDRSAEDGVARRQGAGRLGHPGPQFPGTWNVANRWRTDFLDETSEWEEFPAVSRASRHFDGGANFDEIEFPTKGFSGLTLRLYDPEREEWSLYWASKRTGMLFPPVTGRFVDGRGEFYGDDAHVGKEVRVRFLWSDITAESARWEQAFSADGEKS